MTGHITSNTTSLFAELDRRESNGVEVSLLWNRTDASLSVFVCDTASNNCFELPVAASRMRDTFDHPYAYAPEQAISLDVRPFVGNDTEDPRYRG